jgi:penicillin-binding protein 2
MKKENIFESIKSIHKRFVRLKFIAWIFSILIVILIIRIFYLQIIKGDYYNKLANANCVNIVKKVAPRGNIYDRNYNELVVNMPSYKVEIIPFYFFKNENIEKAINLLSHILDVSSDEIKEKIYEKKEYILEPVTIKRGITEKQLSLLEEKKIEIKGVSIEQEPKRKYLHNNVACHILGYVSEITKEQLSDKKYSNYKAGDIIGQTGIERYYDDILRGEDGAIYILTDAFGKQIKILNEIQYKQGKNLVLTVDYRLQKYAEKLMEKNKFTGVIIAEEPATGEILCMVSKPDYDLANFEGNIDIKYWKKLLRDKNNPLTNRAIQGLYSPGSIFKIVVGVGGLNEKVINTNDSFLCEGIYWIKTWPYKCWKRSGHGYVNFFRGVAESCDIYFYKLGLKMKVELLHKYGLMFGLAEKTNVDLPGEKMGIVPSREWKIRMSRSAWFPGNTVMMAIGQGYLSATPLQILNILNVIANNGYAMVPHLLKVITSDNRRIIKKYENSKLFELNVDKDVISNMRLALRKVVSTGTGKKADIPDIKVAGKTATVENPHGETHAMFVGFAPYEKPEISVLVLIEHGGGGGDVAAPLAREIIEYYLKILRK